MRGECPGEASVYNIGNNKADTTPFFSTHKDLGQKATIPWHLWQSLPQREAFARAASICPSTHPFCLIGIRQDAQNMAKGYAVTVSLTPSSTVGSLDGIARSGDPRVI